MDFSFITDPDTRALAEDNYKAEQAKMQEQTQKMISDAIEKETSGLKKNNQKLLDEKKKIQETLKNFDGVDPKAAKEALKLLSENEEMMMLKDGKFEEVIEKRLSGIRSEHEEELQKVMAELDGHRSGLEKYQTLYSSKMVDDAIREAALKAKVRPEAIEDILNKGRQIFKLGEDEMSVEARDKDGRLRKTEDEKILTTANWIESLKTQSPHYWPQSKGANFDPDFSDMDDLDRQIAQAAAANDTQLFRKLRDKKRKAQGR